MEERTKLLGGKLTILSRVGLGTDLTLDVPLLQIESARVEAGR
jgi:signal transduction histidine kinase